MKKIFIFLLIIFINPIYINAINTSGECVIAMDQNSKRIFYAKNIHKQRPIASISKIMTAILAIESGKLNDEITIGEEINSAYGSGIYIKVGEQLKLVDLVYGLMLRSGNDAALAIANYVGGSIENFVDMMNVKAKELGMINTNFNNPSGLDDNGGNISTAYDMAILTSYAMQNEEYKEIVGTKKYKLETNMNVYSWTNKNKLLFNYKFTTGGKTGFTDVAKRTLVSTATKDDLNLVVVTLNDGNDFSDHQNLYEDIFANYQNYSIVKQGNIDIIEEKYYQNYYFYIKNNFKYPLSYTEKDNIILKFKLEKNNNYKTNDKIGIVEIMLGEEKIGEEGIFLTNDIKTKNWLTKFKEWINNLW